MPRIRNLVGALLLLIPLGIALAPSAALAEKRIALVIGNAGYQAGALNTPANDAGLIAQTLQAAGFDVVGARDLDQDTLRRAFRDFLEKATSSGPDTVAFIYVSGYGLQLEGENYFAPIDARIARDSDVAAETLRISDYSRPLAALRLKASVIVLDAARVNPFAKSGPPLAGGLALVEPEPGILIAFNAAPGTVAPEGQGPYGPYAQALAEMIREGGLPLLQVFDRVRLRVNDVTKGAEVPWHASKVQTTLVFFERAADAPPPAVSSEQTAAIRARPIRDLGAEDAYIVALEGDTLQGYSDFLAAYPDDPMAKRVRAIVAARREAITWRRTRMVDTPPAYWSYLRRYPNGPHAADAHRRLAFLAAALEPPPSFAVLAYDDVPPPPPEEIIYIRRPVLIFDDPVFAFAPPPPPPVIFLAPPPPEFVVLAPPPPPVGIFVLPVPVYRPVPVWVRPPVYVAPPPNNVIYANIHNTVVINNVTKTVTVTNQSGQTRTLPPPAPPAASANRTPAGTPAPVAAIGPALPPSVAQKAVTLQNQAPQGASTQPGSPGQAVRQLPGQPPQPGQPLPGMRGKPLPPAAGAVGTPAVPSAAINPGTPLPAVGAKPATPSSPAPAAKPSTTPAPAAAIQPGTPSPLSTPGGSVTPATPPSLAPAAKPSTTPAPAAAIPPGTPSPSPLSVPGGKARPATPPSQPPAARLGPPPPPSANVKPLTPSPSPLPAPGSAKPVTPPPQQPPAARLAPPPPPPTANIRPVTPPPPQPAPAVSARPVPPPPPPAVATRPMAPQTYRPASVPPPAVAAPRPPTPPPVHQAQPQPKGCPPGKSMAVVNGKPVCK
jgi:uncharacterized caspase-like protein